MTPPRTLALAILLLAGHVSAEDEASQAERATSILARYHNAAASGAASKPKRLTHLVYWTPSDREPCDQYEQRLTRVMTHIAAFYADQMKRVGLGQRTIDLLKQADGLLKIHLVRGQHESSHYDKSSGHEIREECAEPLRQAGIDFRRETIVLFCNLGSWNPETRRMNHRSPYYASGNHRGGTAWQLDEPILDTLNLTDTELMHDGEYGHISLGKHNSIFIGGVAHELGHALGLPHNRERKTKRSELGTALMGSGNRTYFDQVRGEGRGSFLTFAHALRLASHPQFSGSVRGLNQRHTTSWDALKIEPIEGGFRIGGTVQGSPPVYAVIAYTDPAGRSDYDATSQTAVPDAQGAFQIDCLDLASGKPGELRLVALHAHGGTTTKRFGYRVASDGKVDLSDARASLLLTPLIQAIRTKDDEAAEQARADLPVEFQAIANRLLQADRPRQPRPTPRQWAKQSETQTNTLPLSDAQASEINVGWGQPVWDRTPDERMLLMCTGRVFEHGIYAHARSSIAFDLDSEFQKLNGHAGLADGHPGSVVFVIKVDGQVKWYSGLTHGGTLQTFSVDVSEGKRLELIVENGGDGNGGDWGMWYEPTLSR